MKSFEFMIKKKEVMDVLAVAPAIQKYVSSHTIGKTELSIFEILAILNELQCKVQNAQNQGNKPTDEDNTFNPANASEWEYQYCQFLTALPTLIYVFTVRYLECISPYLCEQRSAEIGNTKFPLSNEHADLISVNGLYPTFAETTKLELQEHLAKLAEKNQFAREKMSEIFAKDNIVVRKVNRPDGSKIIKCSGERRTAYRASMALKRAGLHSWNAKRLTNFLYQNRLFYRTNANASYTKAKYMYSPYPFMKKYVNVKCVPGQRIQWWFEDTFDEVANWLRTDSLPPEISDQVRIYAAVPPELAQECDKYNLWQLYL